MTLARYFKPVSGRKCQDILDSAELTENITGALAPSCPPACPTLIVCEVIWLAGRISRRLMLPF